MRILSIETSCDETAISIIDAKGTEKSPSFKMLSSIVHSQAALHAEWSGVVPNLAKREHAKNLVPILEQALKEAGLIKFPSKADQPWADKKKAKRASKILEREPGLAEKFLEFVPKIEVPKIDVIAVTYGPGLEPALWTGINFAKALSLFWGKTVIPINHMEGHILSVLVQEATAGVKTGAAAKIKMPAIALLISGGHTELVLIKDRLNYKVIGYTRDDAVGEAFDKVARMLGLPYPGGPEISRMADKFQLKTGGQKKTIILPRPMINSGDLDFSFSGLKTAVLYKIKGLGELSEEIKKELAHEFEEAVVEVLISKTRAALKKYSARNTIRTLVIGGGVIASKKIRGAFQQLTQKEFPKIKLLVPHSSLATDNATMIAIAGYFRWLRHKTKKTKPKKHFKAEGNLALR